MVGELPFQNGDYDGKGHWIDQNAEGDYTASYSISDGAENTKVQKTHRTFFKPDGGTLYEEDATVTFTPGERNGFKISIAFPAGSARGKGYCFGSQCHCELDVSQGVHLELTLTVSDGKIDALGSSTNRGNFTSWSETVTVKEPAAGSEEGSAAVLH